MLGAEVVEPRVEARETLFAAFGGELALFEGLVVAPERLFGPGDLGRDRREPLLGFGSLLLGLGLGGGESFADEFAVTVEAAQLIDDR